MEDESNDFKRRVDTSSRNLTDALKVTSTEASNTNTEENEAIAQKTVKITHDDNVIAHEVVDELSRRACRICYENSDAEELRAACKCAGSVRYIHQSCLSIWLRWRTTLDCELCKTSYRFHRSTKPYYQRRSPCQASWHLGWIIKELVVLDWFHFLETVFVCASLMIINRSSSNDSVYQLAVWCLVEIFYYSLNIASCYFLLYYERWSSFNIRIVLLDYESPLDEGLSDDISLPVRILDKSANLLRRDIRLKNVVAKIIENDHLDSQ